MVFWPSLVSVLLGAIGWFAFSFVGAPIRRFLDIREEVSRLLYQHGRFIASSPQIAIGYATTDSLSGYSWDSKDKAKVQIRDLGVKLIAFAQNEVFAVPLLKLFRIRPYEAGAALICLSEEIEGWHKDVDGGREDVIKALRLE